MKLANLKLLLVPTDFSEASTVALDAAIDLARTVHAAIEILHVDLDLAFVMPGAGDIATLPLALQSMRSDASEKLGRMVADVRAQTIACTGASESGRTYAAIVDHAARIGAGLIVMGSHGRHGLGHWLLGSVAEKVVQNAPCPVLVIPVAAKS
jgi:universal stress protein A